MRESINGLAAGYASFRYDKVGFGESRPGPGWANRYRDEADVAAAALRWAGGQPRVSAVVAAGESAGAYLACLAAEAGTQADAYVFLGGFCRSSHELYDYNFGRHARRDLALSRHYQAMLAAAAESREQLEIVDGELRLPMGLSRRREELERPPDQMFRHLCAPALVLVGREDVNVPFGHAWRMARVLHDAGNTNVYAAGEPPPIATVSHNGRLELLRLTADGPRWRTIYEDAMGLGRIALRPPTAGQPLVLCTTHDDGRILRHEHGVNDEWATQVIYRGPQGPRGIVAGALGESPDLETVAIFGYSREVELLTPTANGWRTETIFADRDKGHWLATAELDGRNGTREIITSGYSGRIVRLSRPKAYGHTSVGPGRRPLPAAAGR